MLQLVQFKFGMHKKTNLAPVQMPSEILEKNSITVYSKLVSNLIKTSFVFDH